MEIPKVPFLSHHVGKPQIMLPGAITSEDSKFDEAATEFKRNVNVLPGALGLEGAFDEHGDSGIILPGQQTDKEKRDAEKETGKKKKGSAGKTSVKTGAGKKKKKKRKVVKNKKIVPGAEKAADVSGASNADDTSTGSAHDESGEPEFKKVKRKMKRKIKVLKRMKRSEGSDATKDAVGTGNGKEDQAEGDGSVLYTGPHPMNRQMTELQVDAGTGKLDDDAVKGHYGKLVNAYLAPFKEGISRTTFFKIMRRKNYSLSPPGSNKGVQTMLFQLIDKSKFVFNKQFSGYASTNRDCDVELFLMDPYEIQKNSKPFYRTRVKELIWLLSDIAKSGRVSNTEFLLAVHDCVQTVHADHTYRGAVYKESTPTFTIVSCNFSDNIPFPMWEGDEVRGGLRSWDDKMSSYRKADTTPWNHKTGKAVFRGGYRPSMYYKEKAMADEHCEEAGRSRLSYLGEHHGELFDVSVSGKWCGKQHEMTALAELDHHKFKYIIYAEGNCFWADRLNKQVFGPSAVVKQETPCGQFWEPLLKPNTHYLPTDFFFTDTVERLKWAAEHDEAVQEIVKNANEFADNFLSQHGIKLYVEVLLNEYTKLLKDKEIKAEKGAQEVTV